MAGAPVRKNDKKDISMGGGTDHRNDEAPPLGRGASYMA